MLFDQVIFPHHIDRRKAVAPVLGIACVIALSICSALAQAGEGGQRSGGKLKELGKSGVFEIPMVSGFNIALDTGVGNAANLTPRTEPGWFYGIVNCAEGDHFVINGKGGYVPRLWGFLDGNNILISVAGVAVSADRLKLHGSRRQESLQ